MQQSGQIARSGRMKPEVRGVERIATTNPLNHCFKATNKRTERTGKSERGRGASIEEKYKSDEATRARN